MGLKKGIERSGGRWVLKGDFRGEGAGLLVMDGVIK